MQISRKDDTSIAIEESQQPNQRLQKLISKFNERHAKAETLKELGELKLEKAMAPSAIHRKGLNLEDVSDLSLSAYEYKTLAVFTRSNGIDSYVGFNSTQLAAESMGLYMKYGSFLLKNARNIEDYYSAAVQFENAAWIGKNFNLDQVKTNFCIINAFKTHMVNQDPSHALAVALYFDMPVESVTKARLKVGEDATNKYKHYLLFGNILIKEKEFFHASFELKTALETAVFYLSKSKEIHAANLLYASLYQGVNNMLSNQTDLSSQYTLSLALSARTMAELAKKYAIPEESESYSAELCAKLFSKKLRLYASEGKMTKAEQVSRLLSELKTEHKIDNAQDWESAKATIKLLKEKSRELIAENKLNEAVTALRIIKNLEKEHLIMSHRRKFAKSIAFMLMYTDDPKSVGPVCLRQ